MEITQELLLELLGYDEETGKLWWKVRKPTHFTDGVGWKADIKCKRWNARFDGKEAGTHAASGSYKQCTVWGKTYWAHRLIWLLKTGEWPENIDHIDGDRLNNRWGNLREVTATINNQNMCKSKNNTSGVTGVRWDKNMGKWRVQVGSISLGNFENFDEAVGVRKTAEKKYGYHENHGREPVC